MTGSDLAEHSMTFLEMAFRTDRQKFIPHASGIGSRTGACGDSIQFHLVIDGERIREIAYHLDGCLNTNACANAVAEMVEGKTVDAAWAITPEQVSTFLQSLPEAHFHCAELAVGAFYQALAGYARQSGKSWKSAYQGRL
ncbi:MAG: iron-sulfur cluster assembly scaffold protein [Desulfobacterales bacterium]